MLNRYHPFGMRTKWMVPRGIPEKWNCEMVKIKTNQ